MKPLASSRMKGLIPTRAGKTASGGRPRSCRWAHPHAGGENTQGGWRTGTWSGSSPRGRGKQRSTYHGWLQLGLIPTRAGKTLLDGFSTVVVRAHPHAGGENAIALAQKVLRDGSSPRGRGKHQSRRECCGRMGLIPTRAGKTVQARGPGLRAVAHPHAGGENWTVRSPVSRFKGSSPRGRGKLVRSLLRKAQAGLIPTRAGKTRGQRRARDPARAHPHAGGENFKYYGWNDTVGGSSPRGRGKLVCSVGDPVEGGLIPTRAGKTAAALLASATCWAHPHAGGENRAVLIEERLHMGSSPRGRGKHFLTCAFIKWIGQILETLELAVSSGNYSLCDVYATDAPQDQARNTGLALPSSRAAS